MGTRISDEVAALLSIDLSDHEVSRFQVAGHEYHYRSIVVDIRVGRVERPMRVDFVEDWRHEHALLGLRGFFEEFVVRIDGRKGELLLTPSGHPDRPR